MEDKKKLIEGWERGESLASLARRFRVSRPTAYEVIERWLVEGEAGLEERSRRPHSNSRQTKAEVSAALLNLKDRHPHWGPTKLVRLLQDEQIELAASTARDILRRNGRVKTRRASPPVWSPAAAPKISVPDVGHSMSADHKGQFRLGNGHPCFPLTVADPASRYIFAIEALESTKVRPALKVFERVFREWGLPEQIITDNGVPFCTTRSIGGITELTKMWIKLGIQHVRIQPGRPQQNGRHERMHRTLKYEATRPAERTQAKQQRRFDTFRVEFNQIRPHEALGQERPASRVRSYRRAYPKRIEPMEYPGSFEVRTVRANGVIKWRGELVFVSEVLIGERIALTHVDDDRLDLYFGAACLATWNDRTGTFEPPQTDHPGS